MRVLFDQSSHDMRNKGNNALLETAMRRFTGFWPDASLDVITDSPSLLTMYYPDATPISPVDLGPINSRFNRYKYILPRSLWWLLVELREEIRHRKYWKGSARNQEVQAAIGNCDQAFRLPDSEKTILQDALSQYDIFVASGGGYLTDSDKRMLWGVFDRLEAAIARGVHTVMVGQGIGSVKDPELLARAREILPNLDFVLYRNQRYGQPFLESLGVSHERMILTGDDALEMTYQARADKLGCSIGVSLRVAHYTDISGDHINAIRSVLHESAKKHGAPLIAVPISTYYQESDITQIGKLLDGYDRKSIGWRKLETPLGSIKKAGKCRVMVTGTYHGAIFALGQGIPVVAFAKSDEYYNKLDELADEFASGVRVVRLGDEHFSEFLGKAIEDAWDSAEELRPHLLKATIRQIIMAKAGYQCIYDLLTGTEPHK